MKRKDKNSISERICRALDLPAEILPRATTVEIHGTSLVKLQGAGAISLYSPEEIRVRLKGRAGHISVKGGSLCCSSYNMGAVGIEGRIHSVTFVEEDADGE